MTDVTLRYITSVTNEDTITIKDASFRWNDKYWPEKKSIGGLTSTQLRGVEGYLELNFEYDDSLIDVANNIKSTLDAGGTVQYVTSEGVLPMYPSEIVTEKNYVNQIAKKPSRLVLIGSIKDDRTFIVTGILCGSEVVTCGQTNVLCGG